MDDNYKKLTRQDIQMWKKLTKKQILEIQKGYGLVGLNLPKALKHWRKLGFDYNKIVDMISAYKQGQEAGMNYALQKSKCFLDKLNERKSK